MKRLANALAALALVLGPALGLAGPAASQSHLAAATPGCLEEWSVAAEIVRREALVAVDRVHQLARANKTGDVVKSTLCQHLGRWVYRIVVRDAGGQLKALTIDARKPFER